MSRLSIGRLLSILILLSCVAGSAFNADAAERRRGVSRSGVVEGILVDISPESLTIRNGQGDHTLAMTERTKVEGDAATATQVRARYHVDHDGLKTAFRVDIENEPFELEGVIVERTADGVVLRTRGDHVDVTVTDATIIVIGGSPATADDLAVGDEAEIEALYTETGALVAELVVVETEEIELDGVIVALTADTLSLETAASTIDVGLTTETIVRIFGTSTSLADLSVGMHVEIKALRTTDGGLSAIVIEVEDDSELIEIEGVIVSVDETMMVLLSEHGEEVTIGITPDTIVKWRNQILAVADLAAGQHVEVKAARDVEGMLTALRIKVEDDDDDLEEIEGTIVSIEGSVLTVASDGTSYTILIAESTVVRLGKEMGTVADLQAGQEVEVHVAVNPDGSLTAVAIKVELEDDDDHEFEIKGIVSALTADSITVQTAGVGDVVFLVNEETIVRRHHEVIPFSDILVGDEVEVEGVADADGVLTALKIDVESEETEVEAEGEVTAVSAESITILGDDGEMTFGVTSETRVKIEGDVVTIGDVLIGDVAEVEGFMSGGLLVAKKIEIERE